MFGIQGYDGEELLYVPMYRNRLVLICSVLSPLAKAPEITPELLAKEPFLAHSYDSIRSTVFRNMPYLQKNRFYVESRYTTTLIAYVQRNLGFSIIPDYYLGSLPPGVAAPAFETGCSVETGFLTNPERMFSPPLQAMIGLFGKNTGVIWKTTGRNHDHKPDSGRKHRSRFRERAQCRAGCGTAGHRGRLVLLVLPGRVSGSGELAFPLRPRQQSRHARPGGQPRRRKKLGAGFTRSTGRTAANSTMRVPPPGQTVLFCMGMQYLERDFRAFLREFEENPALHAGRSAKPGRGARWSLSRSARGDRSTPFC